MKLEGLDHIAIAVSNPTASAAWYQDVLGLERRHQEEWGDMPIFLMAGSSGLAIFPNRSGAGTPVAYGTDSGFRHLAFRTGRAQFDQARRELEARGIATEFEDHGISHSIYFDDPDGFHLEITTYDV